MPRRNQSEEKRRELLPTIARAFAELTYRRATTAELGKRCGVRENILYRLWTDKKAMFIAAIDYVFDLSAQTWGKLLTECRSPEDGAKQLLEYEARHHGEFGLYRLIFAGLSETDDSEIRQALQQMFERFQTFIANQVAASRRLRTNSRLPDPNLTAWAVLGLGTAANITRELKLLNDRQRQALIVKVGELLLVGTAA
jgi:AcrR family transcriptional regulator